MKFMPILNAYELIDFLTQDSPPYCHYMIVEDIYLILNSRNGAKMIRSFFPLLLSCSPNLSYPFKLAKPHLKKHGKHWTKIL